MQRVFTMAIAALCFTASTGAAQPKLYAIDPFSNQIYEIDPADGAILSTAIVGVDTGDVEGGNGLATDPTTGDMYAVLKVTGSRVAFSASSIRQPAWPQPSETRATVSPLWRSPTRDSSTV